MTLNKLKHIQGLLQALQVEPLTLKFKDTLRLTPLDCIPNNVNNLERREQFTETIFETKKEWGKYFDARNGLKVIMWWNQPF